MTSAVGQGTTVTLALPLHPAMSFTEVGECEGRAHPIAEDLQERASRVWAIAVTAVSAVLTPSATVEQEWILVPMIGIMLLACLMGCSRLRRRTPILLSASLIVATCTVFVLSAIAAEFGAQGWHWQALAPTAPFVLLLAFRADRRTRLLGVTVWAAVAVIIAFGRLPESGDDAVVIVMAGCIGLGFAWAWTYFQSMLRRLDNESREARRRLCVSRLRLELERVTLLGFERWNKVGLDEAIHLLRQIADGTRDPNAEDSRLACANEERYLRQLTQFDPQNVLLSGALMPLLGQARDGGVDLALRMGTVDADDEDSAKDIAGVIEESLKKTRAGVPSRRRSSQPGAGYGSP